MRKVIAVMCLVVTLFAIGGVAQAAQIDITTLPGYEVVTTSSLNFNGAGGMAGWSVQNGKVILGAKIISSGDSISDFSVFRPTKPGETWNNYTLGAGEYGFAFQSSLHVANNGVKIELYYADPLAGYTITKSSPLNYNGAGGWAGWSAPAGNFVTGGGYQFAYDAHPVSSQIALENSVWPHYTYGPNEQGWVVQNDGIATNNAYLYVISAAVPEPSSLLALAGGLGCLLPLIRRRK